MMPPLPAASRPSNRMTMRAPVFFTQSCSLTSSTCSLNNSASYSFFPSLGFPSSSRPSFFLFSAAASCASLSFFLDFLLMDASSRKESTQLHMQLRASSPQLLRHNPKKHHPHLPSSRLPLPRCAVTIWKEEHPVMA